ncbi:sugar ABC transporter substrate-binding protein [Fodinicola acaciae]|uniref:sugar ABC transporter substrate-binding protein n=1 Tax=Fodinicola acaciae TaxID=2681555 RepID=UPI0013D6E107|nr:substrate-binding domain-containing protein [Fodinicola acaciae]
MNRKATVAVVMACVLFAAGCGGSGGASGKLSMGIVVANISLNFGHEMAQGATLAAQHEGGVDFKAVGPPNTDGPAEVQLFQNLTTTSPDGIIVMNLDPPLFTRPESQAIDKGIPVLALDTAPLSGSKVSFYVGNDNYDLGAQLAQEAIKRLPKNPTGQVVVGVPNPGTPVLDSRALGIKETFAKLAPNVQVLGPFQTYSDPNQNYTAWSALVHAHPQALAFLGVGDADSYDLAKIKQTEKGRYLVAGTDVDAQTLRYVKAGVDFVTIDPEHFLKGYIAGALLVRLRKAGKPLPQGWLRMPGLVVDQSNVDKVIAREKSPQAAYAFYKPQIDQILGDQAAYLKPLTSAR